MPREIHHHLPGEDGPEAECWHPMCRLRARNAARIASGDAVPIVNRPAPDLVQRSRDRRGIHVNGGIA